MPQIGGTISLERDTPELARNYEQAGIVQFHHGKFLIGPLALKAGEHVLDLGTGTGRLAEFVAGLVGVTRLRHWNRPACKAASTSRGCGSRKH